MTKCTVQSIMSTNCNIFGAKAGRMYRTSKKGALPFICLRNRFCIPNSLMILKQSQLS